MTPKQAENFEKKKQLYENRVVPEKEMTIEEVVLHFLVDNPDEWYFTWELMGATKWGLLSHATHATLRKLEQDGKIQKAYIGKYVVVYSSLYKDTLF